MSKYTVKDTVHSMYSETQEKVLSVTSNDPWEPSNREMAEIAQATYNSYVFIEIMEMINKRLNDRGKNWRHVFKALVLLNYCLHEGSPEVVTYTKENIIIVKALHEFQYLDEQSKDQGAIVRQKAKEITNLLLDKNRLNSERRQPTKKDSLKNALKSRFIKQFNFNTFENITRIESGGFGTVYCAYSTSLRKLVALKSLKENEESFYEKFVRELTNILAVNNHDNIINFYGISIDPKKETYYLVLQYARDGNLRTYLQNNFKILDWKIKINMAKDITSGLHCIHDENIVHKDLHSKNILVHEGRLLITDLGLSQPLDINSDSMSGGMIAYTDPEYLRNQKKYKRNKPSDIYSLGFLFWELSSGRPPFSDISSNIDPKKETYYLVLQYARDGNLRTYLQNNFKILDWKIKINMAKDITSGLHCIHDENIVHKDLHSKNILVHEGRLLITDLGLSQPLDINSDSMSGGMIAYTDPEYLRNQKKYKRNKPSDIYSLGFLFWELSSGRPPFSDISSKFEIYNLVTSGKREKPINETPNDYINIYSSAWKRDPNQRPTIKNIFDSLKNINLENIYNDSNDYRDIQLDAYINNPSQDLMNVFSKDSVSISSSSTASNWGEVTGTFGMIYSATLMDEKRTVALKSVVVVTVELFFNKLKQYSRASSHENIIRFYGISQKDLKSNEYILVLEYANGGTLRDHLKSHFEKLKWNDKLNLAQQIVKAIEHLHSNDIIHGDLNSKNILFHDNTIKISDFGISGLSTESSKNSLGSIEYLDPILLKKLGKFSKNKPSDIYSIGILLWEISSGKIPYESKFQEEIDLIFYVLRGNREDPIIGTSQDYINIYQVCWDQDPNQRPNIRKILQYLKLIKE
ncbi:hypothetical protein Glove_164g16 [Diversispora epigaea]|uniref:Protein kinase domain-containing protein n=1 Tax=Diversispora epigaea TaxID=1348612 RepID=A0A397IR65_9GLOM|nr:hypothetical protein Glove_164g16 [Diversispora epigaea]